MFHNRKFFTTLLVLLILFSSCRKFLDVTPKGYFIPNTAEQYETMLNDRQVLFGSEYYSLALTDELFIPDTAISIIGALNNRPYNIVNLYSFKPGSVFEETVSDPLWEYSYARIYVFNLVMDGLQTAKSLPEDINRVAGKARTGRAYEYLNLVNAYAKHYDAQTAASDPAVPLLLKGDITQKNLTRASVQAVYDQIEEDLLEAAKGLPDVPQATTYQPSKTAAWALLARMYLYKGNYPQALKYADSVLAKKDTLLDLKPYRVINPNVTNNSRTNMPPSKTDEAENIYSRLDRGSYGANNQFFMSNNLRALYGNTDQRLTLYTNKQPQGKVLDYNIWMPFRFVNIGISTPEIYLIAAECEARVGSAAKAMKLLDKLRNNRIINNTPLVANTNDDALVKVLEERRRELAFLALKRLIDLKRLNKDPRFAKTIEHTVAGNTISLPPNDPRYVLSIPASVLGFQPGMPQNER